jgi:undecaprenyl-diphosphatase
MSGQCSSGIDTSFVSLGYAKVAFLGIIQGITELLPVSSTAHMRVVPALLGWRDPGSAFSAAMQLAALAAVMSYFWKDVNGLATGSIAAIRSRNYRDPDLRLSLLIAAATVPIIVVGALLSKKLNSCGSPFRNLAVVGWACIIMATLLAMAELFAIHRRRMDDASSLEVLAVGLAQVGALIPGVSRSGSTFTAALALGFRREEAARFSFLLGIPAIALSGLKEAWELHSAQLDTHGWLVLGAGISVASVSAFAAIWTLMHTLEKFSSWPFIIYRLGLGLLILWGTAHAWYDA